MSVDLQSGYSGHIMLRNGYCSYAHVHGDQDREGGYVVSTEADFGLVRNRVFGLFYNDGTSYWDDIPGLGLERVIPLDQEIVQFTPDRPRSTR